MIPSYSVQPLHHMYAWLCANKLSLHTKKTNYMVFHNRNKNITHLLPELKIKDNAVTRVRNFIN